MPGKKNLVPFPRSAKKRKQLLQQAESLKQRRLTRFRSLVGWVLVAGILLFSAVNFTLFAPDSLRRDVQILFGALEPEAVREGVLMYPDQSASQVSPVGSALAVINDEALSVLQLGGVSQQKTVISYTSPVLDTNENYILAYDRGGYEFSFSSELTQMFSVTSTAPIRTASIGYGDNCAVITDEAGYKSTVTVYSASSREEDKHIWRWRTPDYYVQEAVLSPSGTHLCALTFRQNGSQFESILQFFDMDAGEVRASLNLGSVVGYAVQWRDDSNVAVVTDRAMFTANRRGEQTSKHDYAAKDLLGYASDESDFVIALRSWSGEARATVIRYDKSGDAKASLDLASAPESLSYAGGQLGVLTSSGLYIYNKSLKPDWKCINTGAAHRVLMTQDGGAWLLYSKYAQRITESSKIAEGFTNDNRAE